MSDYFVWFDPFQEIERANQRAMAAREDGRRDVLRVIENEGQERFYESVWRSVDRVAHGIAREVIEPRLRDAWRVGEDLKRMEEVVVRTLADHARPMIGAMMGPGDMRLRIESPVTDTRDITDAMMRISVRTISPVRCQVQAPMRAW